MGADGGMDGGGTDRGEEEAAVSKLSLEGNRDRNRWQRISRRAKFSPENSCLSFQALKGSNAGQTLVDVVSTHKRGAFSTQGFSNKAKPKSVSHFLFSVLF